MKTKNFLEAHKKKTLKELEKLVLNLRKDIAQLKLESKINPPKDTNKLKKMRKQLSQILTIYQEKKLAETLKKELKS